MKKIQSDVQAGPTRGAQFLDTHYSDWYRKVRMKKLNMSNPFRCILGQLFGSFHLGVCRCGQRPGSAAYCTWGGYYGFFPKELDYRPTARRLYRELTRYWLVEIRNRRAKHRERKHQGALA